VDDGDTPGSEGGQRRGQGTDSGWRGRGRGGVSRGAAPHARTDQVGAPGASDTGLAPTQAPQSTPQHEILSGPTLAHPHISGAPLSAPVSSLAPVHTSGTVPPTLPPAEPDRASDWEESSDDEDAPPQVVSSKPPMNSLGHASSGGEDGPVQAPDRAAFEDTSTVVTRKEPTEGMIQAHSQSLPPTALQPVKKPRVQQPKQPPRNPFAPRHSLLRNVSTFFSLVLRLNSNFSQLLLPEIRSTVSNLSQAIRFLVDNDFLRNVELKPGQANDRLIEVVGDVTEADTNMESSNTRSLG
jgi:hypothetical protein